MVIYILLISLVFEFIISYFLFNKIIISPTCVFSGVFIVATLDLIRNIDYWDVNLHWNTYFIITGGILAFLLGAYLTKCLFHKNEKKYISFSDYTNCINLKSFKHNRIKLLISKDIKDYLILAYNIITLSISFLVECNIVGFPIKLNNVGGIISAFRTISKTTEFALPSYANYMLLFMYAGGLIWLYYVIDEFINKKKIDIIMCLNVILVLAAYFLSGSRGKMLYLLLGGIPIFYFLWCEQKGHIKKLDSKYILYILLILLIFVLIFRATANLMGRNVQMDSLQHLSANLSAPILNLDTFAQEQWNSPDIWGHNTFRNFISIIGSHLGFKDWVYNIDNPYRYANGHPLGNVSTTFYAFYYDFKYLGVFLLTAMMGIISQLIFELCCNEVSKKSSIKYSYILYAEIFTCIAFSFFSNKFYEILFTFSFMETLVCWAILIWFMSKVKIHIKIS